VDFVTPLLGVFTGAGAAGTIMQWRVAHRAHGRNVDHDQIEAAVTRGVAPLAERMSVVETKIDLFWGTMQALSIDAAHGLHQPDPKRAPIDALLEKFTAWSNGTGPPLTEEEETDLHRYLLIIRNWEPGEDVGFPVRLGESALAAILLRTMKFAAPKQK
jgi:hypothetical protein